MEFDSDKHENQEIEISPIEDLMREHGVLHRILLIYRDIISRLRGEKPYDPYIIYNTTLNATNIAKAFIEEYHQVLEEQYIFPRFQQNQQHIQLIQTLLVQHNAAKCLSNMILQLLASFMGSASQCYQLAYLLSQYIRMYEPHSAREDTVVFPAFHNLVSEETLKELGEEFEEIEEQKFGANGFQSIVQQIAQIEQALGIYNLDQYTPDCNL
ncbi:hypothetical protein CLNEO_10960 [Anaerotignum neopropionicum]|uniref:Hemerythrin-like domain-containing protein n=1 Tax=Anaerotignum neopropionicum TaxID=36847 RepID=A0A136WHL7_9FIRM|nr:hemerythrin domain-containing protein [Anaerotignum neopropionicum]KXL53870.1 hypothetical protein CLNEO_10960 [Anaerotignum neopropionicum]